MSVNTLPVDLSNQSTHRCLLYEPYFHLYFNDTDADPSNHSFIVRTEPDPDLNPPARHSSHFYQYEAYNCATFHRHLCRWYYTIPVIRFVDKASPHSYSIFMKLNVAENGFPFPNGYHVFVDRYSAIIGVLRFQSVEFDVYGNPFSSEPFAALSHAIDDVMPKFKNISSHGNYNLIIAMMVSHRQHWPSHGWREGGRCGRLYNSNSMSVSDHEAIRVYETVADHWRRHFYFGVYVREGARLVLADKCNVGNHFSTLEHHNRTLVQGGGFIIVEGMMCFEFASDKFVLYRYDEMWDIPAYQIESSTRYEDSLFRRPIFFLDPIPDPNEISNSWNLHQFTSNARNVTANTPYVPHHHDRWVLLIPDFGTFRVEEWDVGIQEVIRLQSHPDAPWRENVEGPQPFNRSLIVD